MRSRRLLPLTLGLALLAACADEGPVSGPGTLSATLVSPNGAEGAALVVLLGDGVGAVSQNGAARVFSYAGNSVTNIVLVNDEGGDLSFSVAVADTLQKPPYVIVEVAGPDDELRPTTTEYSLELRR